jgi:2-iminobutanoate/2-iminopropanoate deaminase
MKRIIATEKAPAAIGPYSQAVEAGNTLYISGQLPINPTLGKIEFEDTANQTRQVLANIGAILEAAGYGYGNVVKSTVFMADLADFALMNEEYKNVYQENCPARSTFAVKALPMGALVEIETIAVK